MTNSDSVPFRITVDGVVSEVRRTSYGFDAYIGERKINTGGPRSLLAWAKTDLLHTLRRETLVRLQVIETAIEGERL